MADPTPPTTFVPKNTLEYAGVPLALPTEQIRQFVENNISPKDISIFTKRSWPGKNLLGLTQPLGFDPIKPIKLNKLHWPLSKASQWAYIHLVCDKEQLEKINKEIYGDQNNKQFDYKYLVMSDGTTTIKPKMYLLEPRPLSGIRAVNGLYLITLVDQRYYWHFVPCPDFGLFDPCVPQGSSGSSDGESERTAMEWEELYDIIESALNGALTIQANTGQTGYTPPVDFAYDRVDESYLYPSMAFNLQYENLPMVLDAIAYNVGQRVCVGYDNKIVIRNFDKDVKILQKNYQSLQGGDAKNQIRAGGFSYIGDL